MNENEQEKKLILSNLSDLVVHQDVKNKIIWANESTARSFNTTVSKLKGRICYEVFHNRKLPCEGCPVVKAVKTKRNEESEMTSPDGRHWIIRGNPIKDENGNVTSVLEVTIDITERKKTEEIMNKYKEELEKAVEQKTRELTESYKKLEDVRRLADIGVLSSTIAHELRNPLGVISVAVYNLKNKAKQPELMRHYANIDAKVAQCDNIIKNLLSYAQIKQPYCEPIPVVKTIDGCISDLRKKCLKKGIKIEKSIKCGKNAVIHADRTQINALFLNLLSNACQSYPGGKGIIKISAAREKEKNIFKFTIKDDGAGIKKSDMDKIYEPFFTTRSFGIGLGLTVCKQVVDLHKGKMEIKSEEGKGTEVCVELFI